MFLKPSKCTIFQQELPFLGHLLTKDRLKQDPAKVMAVKDTRPLNPGG
jgi:hypothetical protein